MTTPIAVKNGNTQPRLARLIAGWLMLAAAPTFAVMAWVAVGSSMTICSSGSNVLNGMAWMYLLMSFFHLPPWLKIASHRGMTAHPLCNRTEGNRS